MKHVAISSISTYRQLSARETSGDKWTILKRRQLLRETEILVGYCDVPQKGKRDRQAGGRLCVWGCLQTYLISSNSPSGGMKLMLLSDSNLLSFTHCSRQRWREREREQVTVGSEEINTCSETLRQESQCMGVISPLWLRLLINQEVYTKGGCCSHNCSLWRVVCRCQATECEASP